jgi:hypothetical protein
MELTGKEALTEEEAQCARWLRGYALLQTGDEHRLPHPEVRAFIAGWTAAVRQIEENINSED